MSGRSPQRADVAALVPAAGAATRLPGLTGSKEVLPLGPAGRGAGGRPRAVCELLLDDLEAAAVPVAYVVLRPGKWDIPELLSQRAGRRPELAYLTVADSPSVPHTLDAARPFVAGRRVALGFPDIVLRPAGAFARVLERQEATGADLALGLFPTRHPERADMVALDPAGRVERLAIKPRETDLEHTWSIAVWTPRFTRFLHELLGRRREAVAGGGRELYVGDVIQAALEEGLEAEAVVFAHGDSLDVGTPEGLALARAELAGG